MKNILVIYMGKYKHKWYTKIEKMHILKNAQHNNLQENFSSETYVSLDKFAMCAYYYDKRKSLRCPTALKMNYDWCSATIKGEL